MVARIPIIFVLLFSIKICYSQTDWISSDFPGSLVIDIVEKENKYYAAISNGIVLNYDTSLTYQLQLFELDFNTSSEPGFLLNEVVTLPFDNHYGTFGFDYIEETNRWILLQTTNLPQNLQSYRALLLDENFNILSNSTKDTLGKPLTCFIETYQGKTLVVGSIVGPPMDELFYLKYDHSSANQLPEFTITQTNPSEMFWLTSMEIDHRTDNMLVFYYNGIAELNSHFTKVIDKRYNSIHTSDHGMVSQLNDNYISHGATNQADNKRLLVLQKYDSIFNITFADTFGIIGQDNYPFIKKSLDIKDGEILVGGHLDGPITHPQLDYFIKKFYVAKYDTSMNKLWYKEFGGDRAYILYGLELLDNGESMIYGYVRNLTTLKKYAYMMLLDANGDIKTSIEIPDSEASSIQIVNPGSDHLILLNPEEKVGKIQIYDSNGRMLFTRNFDASNVEIPMENYPSGMYPYQILVGNRLEKIGKWIKS